MLTKGSRPTTLTYPNGRVITSNYVTGVDDTISRLSSLSDSGTTLEGYSYLGLGTVVLRSHPQPGVDLTYLAASGTGDAGDKYVGLDRFGRVVDQRWTNGTSDLDRFVHTYDRDSNRLTRDVLATSGPTTLDEAYTYDNLDRLSKVNRGALASGTITDANAAYARNWNLDPLGNWNSLATDADGGGGGSSSSQSRTHNGQNQVTVVGVSGMSFDSNGSLTSDGTTGKGYTYDAWNALVKVTSGGSTIASHEYDAMRRQAQSGTTTPTDERWFSLNWQVLETRPADGKTTQQVWSPVYVDAMVCRDRDTDANGTLDERVYPLHDVNFDVTALVNTSGTVIERFTYDRYGTFTVLDANWTTDADGVSDVSWGNFYQGLPYDAAAGGSVARWRIVLHHLGRPLQADPIGYPDGMSRYEWERSNPVLANDPSGLYTMEWIGGWSPAEQGAITGSMNRIQARTTALSNEINNIRDGLSPCILKHIGPELDELQNRLDDIARGIKRSRPLELRQKDLGKGVSGETYPRGYYHAGAGRFYIGPSLPQTCYTEAYLLTWYSDAQVTVSTGDKDWTKLTPAGLDSLLLHELAHVQEEEKGDQDGTGKMYDPHNIDNLINVGVGDLQQFRFALMKAREACEKSSTQPAAQPTGASPCSPCSNP